MDVGYLGILKPHFESWGAAQVLTDLVIVCVLSCIWMVRDPARRGLMAWPFVLITLVAGSFGLKRKRFQVTSGFGSFPTV